MDLGKIYRYENLKLLSVLENPYNGIKNTMLFFIFIHSTYLTTKVIWDDNFKDYFINIIKLDKDFEDLVKN